MNVKEGQKVGVLSLYMPEGWTEALNNLGLFDVV